MANLLTRWVLSAAAIAAAAALLGPQMTIGRDTDPTGEKLLALAVVAAVFAAVNMFIAPVIKTLSLPFIILTLGLLLLIINAILLILVEAITQGLGVPFEINGFGWAILAALIISIVNGFLNLFFREG